MKKILITGGAGFIGSHLADELIANNYEVVVLDNLSEQVHGVGRVKPEYLNPKVKFIFGDVRDPALMDNLVKDADAIFHMAAMVGVGQSMYEIRNYTDVNNYGTSVLMESIIQYPVEKLVVASSMSIYGEGLYSTSGGGISEVKPRSLNQLKKAQWEPQGALEKLHPIPTHETKTPDLSSIYALSKYDQERMALITGRAYNVPTTAMRFFNVYGTRQSLSNPYTGVLAIFASRLLNDKPPLIFEDGYQQRDFVHVKDVVRACRLALETPESDGEVFNIGSGQSYTIRELALKLGRVMNKAEIVPEVTGEYRAGDIRHCFGDISKAREKLEYEPEIDIEEGMIELASWLEDQIAVDFVEDAKNELTTRGLTV